MSDMALAQSAVVANSGNSSASEEVSAQEQQSDQSANQRPAQARELQKAVQEFRIQIGQMNSGTRRARSGGAQDNFTGRIYEYLRNDALDALPHEVRQRGGTRSLLRRNQFGVSVSGPIRLPFTYDGRGRTFFSFSYEGTRERIARSALFTIPTAQQRNGDFSDLVDTAGQPITIYDPATTRPNPQYDPALPISETNLQYLRDSFPHNIVPVQRLDPVARALLALYPQPNIAVGPFLQNNYWINSPFENQADGIISRVDHTLTGRHQLNFNLSHSDGLRKSPEYYPGPADPGPASYQYKNRSGSLSDTFTASPQTIWTFRLSANYNLTSSLAAETDGPDYPQQLGLAGIFSTSFPRFVLGSYLPLGPPPGSAFRASSYSVVPSFSVSLNRNAHTLRFFASSRQSYVNSFSPGYPAGLFVFGSSLTSLPGINNTGNNFAQFLLGLTSRGEEEIVLHPSYFRARYTELGVRDEYRIRPGITFTASATLNFATPRVEKFNRQSTVSLAEINPATDRPGALIFAGRDGQGRALQPLRFRVEPRLGLALTPGRDRKTVIRLNYELNYHTSPFPGRQFGTQGFNASPLFLSPNDQLQPAFLLRDGLLVNFLPPPVFAPTAANGTSPDYLDASGLVPAVQEVGVRVQRELPWSMAVEIGYAHIRGWHLFTDGLVRLNSVPVEHLHYGEQLYDDAFRNSLRPYPQYRTFAVSGFYPGGDSRNNALTVTVDKRLSAGLYGRASYRFSKLIENATAVSQNPAEWRAEMSLAPYDVTHAVQLSYTYELPFGRGRAFFNQHGIISSILGNWSLSALSSLTGGTPLQLRPLFNRSGGIVSSLRVNVVPGVNPFADKQTPQQWFNPAAFAQPDDFTLGNASRTHPQLREPGEQIHHLSLTRRFALRGDTALEFVTEAFNFPNHANLNDPDTRIGPASSPNLNAGQIIGSTGGRVLQLGLRILF